MAKYQVTRACGHEETIQLFGKIKQREWRLENVEPYKVCYQCYLQKREEEKEKAMEEARELGLPELSGSEKQIKWAEKIRLDILTKIDEIINKVYEKEEHKEILEEQADVDWRYLETIKEKIKQENTKASWWIDNRFCANSNRDLLNVIKKEIHAMQEEENEPPKELIEEAKAEATVRPEEPKTETVAEIRINEDKLEIFFPEKRNDFREIVKFKLDMEWTGKQWERKIKKTNGTVEDRATEAGHRLLAAGFPVRIYDEDLRNKAIEGNYNIEQTRWIMKRLSGKYEGWFSIAWDKRKDDFYKVARAIGGSKWDSPNVVIPPEKFEEVLDFAKMYGFEFSEGAQEVINKARKEKENALIVNVNQPENKEGEKPSNKPPKLEVPENVEVDDEFKD